MAEHDSGISRRSFLKGLGALAGATGAAVAAGCAVPQPGAQADALSMDALPTGEQYPAVPATPEFPPPEGVLRVFSALEARTVEALTARIMPGDADDPGAREAGVVFYIDHMLAYQEGFVTSTYREPPFAEVYEGPTPPNTNGAFHVIWVPADEIERYGYQSIHSPRDIYRSGIATVNRYARETYGADVPDLSEDEQDAIITLLVDDELPGFAEFSGEAFFLTLRRHTAEGMFSDPVYGGNRNLVGWRLVNYPGAQRGYTPVEIVQEGHNREPQSIADLAHFHPGRPDHPNVILPVSGSELDHHSHPPRP
jgi:gluconate 2-dehydrogenase gamma chain